MANEQSRKARAKILELFHYNINSKNEFGETTINSIADLNRYKEEEAEREAADNEPSPEDVARNEARMKHEMKVNALNREIRKLKGELAETRGEDVEAIEDVED